MSSRNPPTSARHYAFLNFSYLGFLGLLIKYGRDRNSTNGLDLKQILEIGIASFSLSKLVAKEKVATWIREPFVNESPEHRPQAPQGAGIGYALGELLTCTRCLGSWNSLILVSLSIFFPQSYRIVRSVLISSAINDFSQSSFRLLCKYSEN